MDLWYTNPLCKFFNFTNMVSWNIQCALICCTSHNAGSYILYTNVCKCICAWYCLVLCYKSIESLMYCNDISALIMTNCKCMKWFFHDYMSHYHVCWFSVNSYIAEFGVVVISKVSCYIWMYKSDTWILWYLKNQKCICTVSLLHKSSLCGS